LHTRQRREGDVTLSAPAFLLPAGAVQDHAAGQDPAGRSRVHDGAVPHALSLVGAGLKMARHLALAVLLCACTGAWAAPHAFVAAPIPTSQYGGWQRHAGFVPMQDGTRLAMTWYLPTQGPTATRFPVLL